MLNLNLVQIFLKRILKYSEQLIFSAAKHLHIHCVAYTLPRNNLLSPLYWGEEVAMEISYNQDSATMAIEKITILGAVWSYQLNSPVNLAHLALAELPIY